MKLKTSAAMLLVAGLCAPVANAEPVAPGDVKIEDGTIAMSLTGNGGNAEAGAKTMVDRSLGNCLACHAVTALNKELFHGDVGPSLDGVGSRWNEAELRAIIVNSKAIFSDETVMPGFYSLEVGLNPRKDLAGKTILTAEQVEDVVAYLATLKE